jgi:tetratricopeptide (TPR) repeat protein
MSDDLYDNSQTSSFVRDNIVKIVDEDGNFYGTGFFIEMNRKKYCITCHHCICRLSKIFVEKENIKHLCKWDEDYSDMDMDISVLSLINDISSIKPLKNNLQMLPKLKAFVWGFSSRELKHFPKGSPVENGDLSEDSFLFHWEEEKIHGNKRWNIKPEVNVNIFQFNGKFDLGFSGAPVCYYGDKKVIGIFTARDNDNGYVIPIQTLLKKFHKNSEIVAAQPTTINAQQYLEKGNLFYDKRKFNEAIMQYDEIIKDDNYLSALSNKGRSLAQLGENKKAIDIFNLVLEINSNFVHALNGMGSALHNQRKYQEAKEYFDKALSIDPNYVPALNNKGVSLNNQRKYQEAKEYFDKALSIDPNYAIALNNKGISLRKLLKYQEAIEYCDKALSIDPNYVLALNNKGISLNNQGKYQEAIEYFDKALSIDPNDILALNNKDISLRNLNY